MFGLSRFKKPQTFKLTLSVGSWLTDQTIAIPYPVQHQQQRVTQLTWTSDGMVIDHGGCIVVTHGTQATVTATIHTQPFQQTAPVVIQQCYDQTIAKLRYGAPIPGLYTLADVLRLPEVDCGGFSVYLLSLLAAAGVQARLVAGFWAGYVNNGMHAWVEAVLPDGVWLPLDPSTDWLRQHHRTKKFGGCGQIGSDRIVCSIGTEHELVVNQHMYQVGMLQLPMVLLPDGKFSYLADDHYRLITQR